MALEPGTTLGPYQIVAPIGAGGMGEVYKAKDTRLDRTVAIKVLPEHLAESPERKERFEREAKAISQLNHPHICTLYDVGEQDGVAFLVMEHIEGETLADRLKRGPLPVDKALEYGMQIGDGLDIAHRAGIVHRDLKPPNVMLTRSGVKLLDFGVAKLLDTDDASGGSDAPTMQKNLTGEEAIIGTLQYMAPEQLERKPVDARTDIFAFGATLREMLSGKKTFDADSQAGLIANIVHVDPPALAAVPPALDRTVKKCLAKDPDARWQSARDLADELGWIARGDVGVSESVPQTPRPRHERLWQAGTAVSALALVALAFVHFTETPPLMPLVAFSVQPPPGGSFSPSNAFQALSPDGTRLAFVANIEGAEALWVRRLDAVAPQLIPGTEDAGFPFWSADGRSIGFFGRGQLMRVDPNGGGPQVVCDVRNGRGTWNDRDDILFSSRMGVIQRVPARGGTAVAVTALDPDRHETSHVWPQFLPDGNRFLYVALSEEGWMLKVAALDATDVNDVMPVESAVFFAPPGYLLFARQGFLMVQAVDPDSLELVGEPVQIARTYPVSPIGSPGFSVSQNGVLANREEAQTHRLLWYDRQGGSTPALPRPGVYINPVVSPDGERLAFESGSTQERGRSIWVVDRRGVMSRFTFNGGTRRPQWSPDGRSIFFSTGGAIYRKDAAGGSDEDVVFSAENMRVIVTSISPDGLHALADVDAGSGRGGDIWVVPLVEDAEPVAFLDSPFMELDGRFSPDGRFVAYSSWQSGRGEVYVRPYPPASGQWQVSTNGGTEPRWSDDGRELYYLTREQELVVVPLSTTPTFEPGVPQTLFELRVGSRSRHNYDVVGSQRFLVSVQDDEDLVPTTITLNWPALLDR